MNNITKLTLLPLLLTAVLGGHDTQNEISTTPSPDSAVPFPAAIGCQSLNPKVDSVLTFTTSILCIFEDRKGNLWFGSDGEGVCRFDGRQFTYFSENDGLCKNQIRTIQEDQNGNLLFGIGGAVCIFNGSSFSSYPVQQSKNILNSFMPFNINSVGATQTKSLWFEGGPYGEVFKYDGFKFHNMSLPEPKNTHPSHSSNWVFSTYQDTTDDIWFGTLNSGVVQYDGSTFKRIYSKELGNPVRTIFKDKAGTMWFGSNGGGVVSYNGQTLHNFTAEHSLTSPTPDKHTPGTLSRVWAIEQDVIGNMWFATIDAGIWSYDGENFTNYTTKDGLVSNSIYTIYRNRAGSLLYGTADGGVYWFDSEKFVRLTNGKEYRPC